MEQYFSVIVAYYQSLIPERKLTIYEWVECYKSIIPRNYSTPIIGLELQWFKCFHWGHLSLYASNHLDSNHRKQITMR